MLWAVVSSARCKARRLDNPVPSMSGIVDPRRSYRRNLARLELIHIWRRGRGNILPPGARLQLLAHLPDDRHELAGVVRIGGIAAALQRRREGAHVGTRAERGRVARVVAQQA